MSTALDFFTALFSSYAADEELRLEIRPLLPEWKKSEIGDEETIKQVHRDVRRWYTLSPKFLANAAVYCAELAETFDVYYGVLPRIGRSGSQNDIPAASYLFCDVDGGEEGVPGAIARFKMTRLPRPHLAVRSGGGIHLYWPLSVPILFQTHSEREEYKSLLRRLARAIGGVSPMAHADLSACEAARILRVPGTFNHKREDEPRPVTLLRNISLDWQAAHSADWWRFTLPAEPGLPPKPRTAELPAYDATGFIADGLKRWAQKGYPEGNRHKDFVSAAAWLVRDKKLSPYDATELLWQKAQCSPGRRQMTRQEIEDMVQWA